MAESKQGAARTITRAERRRKALELRKGGASLRAIADALACSPKTAERDVKHALSQLAAETRAEAEQLRALQRARLEAILLGLWRKATSGDVGAAAEARRTVESLIKLDGLALQPDATPPVDLHIVLTWADGRNILDVTPNDDDHPAPALPEPADDRGAPGPLPYRVRWATLGQEPAGGDAEPGHGHE